MFKKERILTLLLLGALLVFSLLHIVNKKRELSYRSIDTERLFHQKKLEAKESVARQKREGISKQIVYSKENKRIRIRLTSQSSELAYSKKSQELIESFRDLSCLMQEEIKEERQAMKLSHQGPLIRTFFAPEASYHYGKQVAEAEEVRVAHYLIEEKESPLSLANYSPFFSGVARKCEWSLKPGSVFRSETFELRTKPSEAISGVEVEN